MSWALKKLSLYLAVLLTASTVVASEYILLSHRDHKHFEEAFRLPYPMTDEEKNLVSSIVKEQIGKLEIRLETAEYELSATHTALAQFRELGTLPSGYSYTQLAFAANNNLHLQKQLRDQLERACNGAAAADINLPKACYRFTGSDLF